MTFLYLFTSLLKNIYSTSKILHDVSKNKYTFFKNKKYIFSSFLKGFHWSKFFGRWEPDFKPRSKNLISSLQVFPCNVSSSKFFIFSLRSPSLQNVDFDEILSKLNLGFHRKYFQAAQVVQERFSQQTFTCSNSSIETLQKCVKYVQSYL